MQKWPGLIATPLHKGHTVSVVVIVIYSYSFIKTRTVHGQFSTKIRKLPPCASWPKLQQGTSCSGLWNYRHPGYFKHARVLNPIIFLVLKNMISAAFWAITYQMLTDLLRIMLRIAVQMGSDWYSRLILWVVLVFLVRMLISPIIAQVITSTQMTSVMMSETSQRRRTRGAGEFGHVRLLEQIQYCDNHPSHAKQFCRL